MYTPPFRVSSDAINLISDIAARVERFVIKMEQTDGVRLRKINRTKTIRGSLAIEGNSLSEDQVSAIIEGKHVIAPKSEIQEVRNAIKAYDSFMSFDPYNHKDLLKAHGLMMMGLVDNLGQFRRGGVCVAGNEGISHIAPPADRIPFLVDDLFKWLKSSKDHLLIKSSVFHYEFEFIHPFEDGNGRMGRFWQSRILSEWNPVFAHLPIENMIWENQAEYYKAIKRSTQANDSGIFIDFMLSIIRDSLCSADIQNDTVNETENDTVNLILNLIRENPTISYNEIAKRIGISRVTVSRKIAELKNSGLLIRHGADKNGWWEALE